MGFISALRTSVPENISRVQCADKRGEAAASVASAENTLQYAVTWHDPIFTAAIMCRDRPGFDARESKSTGAGRLR